MSLVLLAECIFWLPPKNHQLALLGIKVRFPKVNTILHLKFTQLWKLCKSLILFAYKIGTVEKLLQFFVDLCIHIS